MGTIDCLVVSDRVLVLDGSGPWLLGPAGREGVDLVLEAAVRPRCVRVARTQDGIEMRDLDGEPLHLRGARRTRLVVGVNDTVAIGRSQVLVASLARAGTVRWQDMLATAPGSLRQLADIARAAGSRAPVFIAGESGTGKELAARAVHEAGERQGRPFIALNCAALPETLAESELFGVERGAYTGATRTRAGAFAQAQGGTLFLDEIGELSPMIQAKLLRTLESGEVQPVGGARAVKLDVRIVAASWRDLDLEAEAGRFRHDLLHRLCVLRVDLLPLRERPEDVLPLLEDLLRRHDAIDLMPDPVTAWRLRQAPWRGNVRELRNGVQRAVASRDPQDLLPRERIRVAIEALPLRSSEHRSREIIAATLRHYRGNRRRTATALGVSRSTFYRWMHQLEDAGATPTHVGPWANADGVPHGIDVAT